MNDDDDAPMTVTELVASLGVTAVAFLAVALMLWWVIA